MYSNLEKWKAYRIVCLPITLNFLCPSFLNPFIPKNIWTKTATLYELLSSILHSSEWVLQFIMRPGAPVKNIGPDKAGHFIKIPGPPLEGP